MGESAGSIRVATLFAAANGRNSLTTSATRHGFAAILAPPQQ
jgi:hypothetical protein